MNRPQPAQVDRQPGGIKPPVGYQSWHDLLFVHWCLPVDVCQRLLPAGLTVDTCQGSAWIGLVAFWMSGVRPPWFPAIPYLSRFAETNLRTYVRAGDHEPGIWFFSLEAAWLPAVLVARARWRLPYHWARMRVRRRGNLVSYASRRWLEPSARANIAAQLEAAGGPSDPPGTPAKAGTLEEFLVERYVFYNLDRHGRLQQGRVRHRPYPLISARLKSLDQSLTAASGPLVGDPPDHVIFSPGVDVEIVGLQSVTR
jgi:uncharacterized protein